MIPKLILPLTALLFLTGFGAFAIISWHEKEPRAAQRSSLAAIVGCAFFWGMLHLPPPLPHFASGALVVGGALAIGAFLLPQRNIPPTGRDAPSQRVDEREIIFARARLEPGSEAYNEYYARHPRHKVEDEKTRAKPGLLSPESQFANPYHFASTEASFFLTEALSEAVNGPTAPERVTLSPKEMTAYIKNLARFYGALDVGVTKLEPYHVYSHIGRGCGTYGAPISLSHTHAIAFTVEMNFEMTQTAPQPPLTMETGKEYVEAARIAVQLAAALREMGHPARAHIDGNYRVIAPLVARDAGLGEIGRMSILMTPRQGPRVRVGVVTTDLELIPDGREPNTAIIDFCNICQKCATTCPSRSIPFGKREEIDGALRWKINPDTCFRYWNVAGTDCGRCMAVCPFSHPDNFAHNFVRWGIQKSALFRRAALWMDDFFYGEEPEVGEGPGWVGVG
ncbi:MAG: 3-chloro-4-hydroxyphenylacetate reductive dehalogenase [Chloroflexi bacterium]|nr:3-chloro-4-hydroxyphenylacetate reductive dehalogenase [Chloroflexota bacterium]